jgi:rhamnosyltransferase subunit B
LRCLLVSLDPPEAPLPAGTFHVAHARFEDLFPRCRAVVHHAGIGTTAKCIAAGVPQLIIPRSHDQPDNASRIRILAANTLSEACGRAEEIAKKYTKVVRGQPKRAKL